MAARSYFEKAIEALQKLIDREEAHILSAADLLADAVVNDKRIFSFGASHSFILTEELVYRTGGLMLINPIYPHGMNLSVRPLTATSRLERVPGLGKELPVSELLHTREPSGRNAVTIDMAVAARERGIQTIGITSIEYSRSVSSRHPSGKKLADLCDIVIDNGAPTGDTALTIPGFAQKMGPLSTVTGCAIVNAIAAEVVARLVARGIEPPVFLSANLDGGDAHNARLLAENRHRIFYM